MTAAAPGHTLLPSTAHALLHRLATAQAEGRAPSMTAALFRDGVPVWSAARGTGPCGPTTQYRIGSITKTLVAALVLRLRDEGRLDLADTLGTHLPRTAPGTEDLTVAQLLAHTGGLSAETPGPWWERTPGTHRPELADILDPDPLRHPPGRRFHYSNPGYALLGALVARLRGRPWQDVLATELLDPLGMTATAPHPEAPHARGWAVHPWADVLQPEPETDTGVMGPAGQLWSTAADLCRWGHALTGAVPEVLRPETAAEMREPASGAAPADGQLAYGLGLQLAGAGGRVLVGHSGSMPGFLAGLWLDDEERSGAVVLTNATSGPAVTRVAADLLRLLAELEPRLPDPWTPLPAGEADPALLALTGTWYWGAAPYGLRLCAERFLELAPLSGTGRATRLRPEEDGTWRALDGYHTGETLRVERTPDGRPGHLDLGSFVFTREPYGPDAPVPGGVDPEGWRGLPG